MRVGLAITAVACALLIFALSRVFEFGAEATQQDEDPPSEIAADEFCPRHEPSQLPSGFTLRRRETRNLGGGTFGRSYVYGDGTRSVEVHVGFEALDLYEDLDFVEHEVSSGGVARTVHIPRAIGSGFIGVTWEDEEESPPCSDLTLIGRRLDEPTLLEIAAGVRRVEG
jgi:hypothetical protein